MSILDFIELLTNLTDLTANAVVPLVAYIHAKKENGPSNQEGPQNKK